MLTLSKLTLFTNDSVRERVQLVVSSRSANQMATATSMQ